LQKQFCHNQIGVLYIDKTEVISQKQKHILTILADGQFHSGTELAKALMVSRSAVWKQIDSLSEYGVLCNAVNGKGYRLEQPLELLDSQTIYQALDQTSKAVLNRLEIHDHIDSTNNYLMQHAVAGQDTGFACFAEFQTEGKGRRGRHWVSPFGKNIYLSVLWRFAQSPAYLAGLSLAAGVAVIRTLQQSGIAETGLKWPNDIYWQSKKLGGILVEVTGESAGPCCAVIGIGLNLNLSPQDAQAIDQPWTDLYTVAQHNRTAVTRNRLASVLLNNLLQVINDFAGMGFSGFVEEWRQYDCLYGQEATLYIGKQQLSGIVRGIDESGCLLLESGEGKLQAYASGEVSFNQSRREPVN